MTNNQNTINVPHESYLRIFLRFLRFGLLAWGGPVAQIAMIRQELVDEQKWIPNARFNRVLAVYQALPGPEAHEMCVYFGMLSRGRLGGFLGGLGFMLPGFLLMFALSWFYLKYGLNSPLFAAFFFGCQAAVGALILRAVHRIGGHALVDRSLWGGSNRFRDKCTFRSTFPYNTHPRRDRICSLTKKVLHSCIGSRYYPCRRISFLFFEFIEPWHGFGNSNANHSII